MNINKSSKKITLKRTLNRKGHVKRSLLCPGLWQKDLKEEVSYSCSYLQCHHQTPEASSLQSCRSQDWLCCSDFACTFMFNNICNFGCLVTVVPAVFATLIAVLGGYYITMSVPPAVERWVIF